MLLPSAGEHLQISAPLAFSGPKMSPALKPFVLYYHGPSPNPWKVGIILEELGLPWELASVDNSELKQEPFISLNPNGRVPALVDPNKDVTLWEVSSVFLQFVVRSMIPVSMD